MHAAARHDRNEFSRIGKIPQRIAAREKFGHVGEVWLVSRAPRRHDLLDELCEREFGAVCERHWCECDTTTEHGSTIVNNILPDSYGSCNGTGGKPDDARLQRL